MLLIVVVSLFTVAPAAEAVKPYIWQPSWIRTLDQGEIKRPWYKSIKFWFALYAAWCYIYWRFW